jgi:hypothetical protein
MDTRGQGEVQCWECNSLGTLISLFLENDIEEHEIEPYPFPVTPMNYPLNKHCPK